MKTLLPIPLLFVCISIVGCNDHWNNSNVKSIDSAQNNDSTQPPSIHTDSIKHIATKSTKTEPVSQEELNDSFIQKIEVSEETGSMWLDENIRMDWRIFGYEKPDTTSRKMILLSVFTSDVEGNPYRCPYGSYYESSGMNETGLELRFVSKEGAFIKADIVKSDTPKATVYIEKKWIEFD